MNKKIKIISFLLSFAALNASFKQNNNINSPTNSNHNYGSNSIIPNNDELLPKSDNDGFIPAYDKELDVAYIKNDMYKNNARGYNKKNKIQDIDGHKNFQHSFCSKKNKKNKKNRKPYYGDSLTRVISPVFHLGGNVFWIDDKIVDFDKKKGLNVLDDNNNYGNDNNNYRKKNRIFKKRKRVPRFKKKNIPSLDYDTYQGLKMPKSLRIGRNKPKKYKKKKKK